MNPRTSPVVVACSWECRPCTDWKVATALGAILLVSCCGPKLLAQLQDVATVPFAAADAG